MALRVLDKFRFINIIRLSRTLSSVAVVRNHVKEQGGINKQLLDTNFKNSLISKRLKYNQKKGSKPTQEVK